MAHNSQRDESGYGRPQRWQNLTGRSTVCADTGEIDGRAQRVSPLQIIQARHDR
jgi:hypothetical protein